MCTVTFIPTETGIFICSNRDEHKSRPIARLPKNNTYKTENIWYPIDGSAGGSWIALKKDSNAAVLLNGAFEKHNSKPPYKKSRGIIFLSIVKQENLLDAFQKIDLENIEPFTLVLKTNSDLYECNWDGYQKHYTQLNSKEPHIWSSCTLYDKEVRKIRNAYFQNWLSTNKSNIDTSTVLELHQSKPFKNKNENFLLEREDGISTVSITCLKIGETRVTIHYHDLKQGDFHEIDWETEQNTKQTILNV